MIKERKRTYTQEEVNELKKWFDSQELPPTMQIDKAAFTPNLKDTVDMLFEQAYVCYENPKMQGCLYCLLYTSPSPRDRSVSNYHFILLSRYYNLILAV